MSKFKIEDGIIPLSITKLFGRVKKKSEGFPLKEMKPGQSVLIASGIKVHQAKKKYTNAYHQMRRQVRDEELKGKFQIAFDEQSNLRIFKLA